MMENRTVSAGEAITRFFSYFTILTNILVAVYFTLQLPGKKNLFSGILNKPGTLTALTVYITVVGLVYQIALRHIWQPRGMQKLVDELLHSIIPILVIIYWLFYELKSGISWKHIPVYLLYPLFYLGFILFRGMLSGFYPYPFLNVLTLGWSETLLNIGVLFTVFVALSILLIGVGKYFYKQQPRK